MSTKRKVEVFSAGCQVCKDAVEMVKRISCQDCEINVLNMKESDIAERAKTLGIRSVMDDLVCYWFEYTSEDIKQDFLVNGRSLIMEKITAEKRFDRYRCATLNPKGQ